MSHMENIGFVALVVTVAMAFISYVTPYWSVHEEPGDKRKVNMGLIAHCEPVFCKWYFSDAPIQNALPGKDIIC